jgi:predicted amino acid racemase
MLVRHAADVGISIAIISAPNTGNLTLLKAYGEQQYYFDQS